ncbi:hypothetical protein [Amycolatopsis thermoflava]|uniref:hypothetical protein n=1 Tax=Amycolatopsis thermoflava TaxID=84480 RepID=UPI003F4A852E
MALTITEANAVNALLGYALLISRPTGPVTEDQAREAAELLADKAHRALAAGLTAEQVRDHWRPSRLSGPIPVAHHLQPDDVLLIGNVRESHYEHLADTVRRLREELHHDRAVFLFAEDIDIRKLADLQKETPGA